MLLDSIRKMAHLKKKQIILSNVFLICQNKWNQERILRNRSDKSIEKYF